MKLGVKLILGFGAIALGIIISGVMSITANQRSMAANDKAIASLRGVVAAWQTEANAGRQYEAQANMIFEMSDSPLAEFRKFSEDRTASSAELSPYLETQKEQDELRNFNTKIAMFEEQATGKIASAIAAGASLEELAKLDGEADAMLSKARESLASIEQIMWEEQAASEKEADHLLQVSRAVTLGGAVLALVLSIVVTIMLMGAVRKPLNRLVQATHTMSQGDFTTTVSASRIKDEIGLMTDALIMMQQNTRHLIQEVEMAATQVASASQELAAGADETSRAVQQVSVTIQEVARGAQETTSNVTQAQSSLEQAAGAVNGVSREIEDVSVYALQAAGEGREGKKNADNAVQVINRAAGNLQHTTRVVHALGEKTHQIGDFISIITGIADQTNLLALNAAIEAARAGDAGRGFAVVAEEVRKLAEESNVAAVNITKLVQGITQEMNSTLAAMEASDREVGEGVQSVQATSQVLEGIVQGIESVSQKVQAITAAAEEITANTAEVVNSMQAVSAVAEENSAACEEVGSAAEQQTASMEQIAAGAGTLARLSQELQEIVGHFRV